MAQRFHLDLVNTTDGTIWFTLVVDDPVGYFVEEYNDSPNVFIKGRTKLITPCDLAKHEVNGVSLIKLVENKLQEIVEAHHPRPLLMAVA
jgi:hypothetical protein